MVKASTVTSPIQAVTPASEPLPSPTPETDLAPHARLAIKETTKMFSQQGHYPEVRLCGHSIPRVIKHSKSKKVTGAAIKAALKEFPNLEFQDAFTGQTLTTQEAKAAGVKELVVRYNNDFDLICIRV
jgi:hypothetical protein